MKTEICEIFDTFKKTDLVAVLQRKENNLCVVWIYPDSQPMTEVFAEQLMQHLQKIDITAILDGPGMLNRLARDYRPDLHPHSVYFNICVVSTSIGLVVQVVLGSELDISDYRGIPDDPSD